MSSMTWDDVALYYGTDKSSLGHGYMSHYQGVLGTREVHSVLEVGVADGRSIAMWADLFPDAEITGLDIDPECRWGNTTDLRVLTVNASNRHDVDQALGLESFDLIVDDGSHSLSDVSTTLGVLAGRLTPNGVYAIEDTVRGGGSFADTDEVLALLPLHGLKPLSRTRSQQEGVSLIMAVAA